MSTLTPRQREVLQHRIERAICWGEATAFARDVARRTARAAIAEIDLAGADGKAAERAITAIADRLEKSA